MKIKLLRPTAQVPRYAHPGEDAAFDLYNAETTPVELKANGGRYTFPLGFATEFWEGYCIKIEARSGLASKWGVIVPCGVIDAGYRGEWAVTLINTGSVPVLISCGDRIAQGVVHEVIRADWGIVPELSASKRGGKGHGGTGR